MPKKLDKKGKPTVHDELSGFDIKINEFGVMETSFNVDKINSFLDENVEDKKLWTENPCVPGSIPGGTTTKALEIIFRAFLFSIYKLLVLKI